MVLPSQRWRIASANPLKVAQIVRVTGLPDIVAQILLNRGVDDVEKALGHINPESESVASPYDEFVGLGEAVELLKMAIERGIRIAICGDYDADGMTSTALLIRAFNHLGAVVEYAIPSRMKEGYGINVRLVEEFDQAGVGVIITVDNGISALEPLKRAQELGMQVIVTDHHDLPEVLPPATAILNPKLLATTSVYRGLAGVGVAYILAVCTAQSLEKINGLTSVLLQLFTLGTIADLAPVTGINRRWLRRGLKLLPKSELMGVRALIEVSGMAHKEGIKPEDIGFQLGPRINAIGRLDDPQIVIELLTTEDENVAMERALQCEKVNRERQLLCEEIQQEAIHLIESTPIPWQKQRVLVLMQPHWHHGVIGLVASRLVERYGVPTFLMGGEEHSTRLRGSARGIDEFDVFAALNHCKDLLGSFGGHKKAGGFSLDGSNLEAFTQWLSDFACSCLAVEHLQPLIKIDAQLSFANVTEYLYHQLDQLNPWGIENDTPIFWTPNVRVLEQIPMGKQSEHLRLSLMDEENNVVKAVAWRWGGYVPLPTRLDIAYKLRENHWQGNTEIQLELVGGK